MNIMKYTAAVITVSDRGFAGKREDTSGPALCEMLAEQGWDVIYTALVPDDKEMIQSELRFCADEQKIDLVLTTGGTGFSPCDVTPEATLELLERLAPGIPEAMRAQSMKLTPHGCLSRAVAGIRGGTLIVNLPGSKRASTENFGAVCQGIRHGIKMLKSEGSADCAAPEQKTASEKPSLDQWLREAKSDPNADRVGMYLTHNGVVRATSRAQVRENAPNERPVIGMRFSYDAKKMEATVAEALKMEGVYYARVWMNDGTLRVGDDLMLVLIGADIRPHAVRALECLLQKLKTECVTETELRDD